MLLLLTKKEANLLGIIHEPIATRKSKGNTEEEA